MPARFYAPSAEQTGDRVDLPSDEAVHLLRVLRLSVGAAIRVFNGRGGEFEALVTSAGKTGVRVELTAARAPTAAEPGVAVTLAQAVLKTDGMDDVVRDAVMIGATAIQPVVTTRAEATLRALERGHRRERWERVAVSSCKQCGRATVPAIREPVAFDELVAALTHTAGSESAHLMLVEPSASTSTVTPDEWPGPPPRHVTLIAGPEGGWTPDELALGSSVCQLVTLGPRTIRANAVGLVAIAALFAKWKEI